MATGNVKLTPLGADDKPVVVQSLQGKIYFEKILTAGAASLHLKSSPGPTLPSWFIQSYGEKIRKSAILRTHSSTTSWPVTLSIWCYLPDGANVRFGLGWKAFATHHGLLGGDELIFELTAISEFKVYVFRGIQEPPENPSQKQRKRTCDFDRPLKKAKKPDDEYRNERLGGVERGSAEGPNRSIIVKRKSTEAYNPAFVPGSPPSRTKDVVNLLPGFMKPEEESGDEGLGVEGSHGSMFVRRKSAAAYNPSFFPGCPPSRMNGGLNHLPGFMKTLTASNVSLKKGGSLEFPGEFWESYGHQIRSVVQLQGIHEQSPVRTMPILTSLEKDTRHYLRAEWRAFVKENHLHEGQQLLFTLAADSFFVVRDPSAQ